MIGRFLRELFSVFFRWWWAAITGLFTIVGFLSIPPGGLEVGRLGLAVLLFVLCALVFLVLSLIAVSWRWYTKIGTHPIVLDLVPEQPGGTPLTLLIEAGVEPVPPGTFLALFRRTERGVEACAAVLEIKSDRQDGRGLQAEPRWISSLHKTALQTGQVGMDHLSVRPINAEVLALVERCIRENS